MNPPDLTSALSSLPVSTDRQSKRRAITQQKRGKAPGPDGIPPEAVKADFKISVNALYELFGKIWKMEEVPIDWKHGHIVKIPKKGNLKECKNWRGITLLSMLGTIFNRILLERMKAAVDKLLRDEQAGFCSEISCTDQIAIPRIIIEQSLEWNTSLYVTFIDFQQVFGSIDRNTFWSLLQHHGIPQKLINLIKANYEPSTCQIIHNGNFTESFPIRTGVRQGCLLSLFLFLVAIDWAMKETTRSHPRGIQWGLFRQLEDIDFADDVALLPHRQDHINEKVSALDLTAAKVGLETQVKRRKWEWLSHTL